MSIALMTLAWKSDIPSGRKFVLLSLCDNANDQGECYPSIATIAQRCGMGERTVQGHIQDLRRSGALTLQERTGRSTVYTIDPRRFCTPADLAPPQISHPTPADLAPPPPQISHPTPADLAPITIKEPSIEPKTEKETRATALPVFPELASVDPQVLKDWIAIRKAKRAPMSATAIAGMEREAAKAGLTLAQAVTVCCERSWAAFRADWMQGATQARPFQTAKERDTANAEQWFAKSTGGLLGRMDMPDCIEMEVAHAAQIGNR